jgi:hypothetical protein
MEPTESEAKANAEVPEVEEDKKEVTSSAKESSKITPEMMQK